MILHLSDWDKYPNAIPDFNTINRSWVRYAGLLKSMGIENHAFCLALHNPDLQGVDPYDPNLTSDQKLLIIEECTINPWYFFREVARVPAKGSIEPELFRANRGNISLYWLFFNNIMTYLIQIRQTGKSLSVDNLFRGLLSFWCVNTSIVIITKDNKLRIANAERLKDINKALPPYLQMTTNDDMESMDGITVKSLDNRLDFLIGQKSPVAALSLGRGLTTNIFGIDEFNFIYNNDITVPAALTAGSAARDTAIRNGQPAGTIFYSTVGYLNTPAGKYGYSVYNGAMRWTEKLFDCGSKEALQAVVEKHSRGAFDIVLIELNHRQLGYTDEWLRKKMRESGLTGDKAAAEYLNIWSLSSSTPALRPDMIKLLNSHTTPPIYTEISPNGFSIRWYIPEEVVYQYRNKSIIVGLDTSEGIGRDDLGLIGLDPITGKVVCSGKYNGLNLIEFGEFLFWFMETYRKVVLVPERKSTATTLVDQLTILFANNKINIFTRVFNWVIQDSNLSVLRLQGDNLIDMAKDNKSKFGFTTAGSGLQSREGLYNPLHEVAKTIGNVLYDIDLVEQMTKLNIKNDKIDHLPGEHDDLVIALLLVWWFIKNGKNLEVYGLKPHLLLTGLTPTEEMAGELSKVKEAQEKARLIQEVDSILTELEGTKDPVKMMRLGIKLNTLYRHLDDSDLKSINIHERMKQLEEKNKRNTNRLGRKY